MQKGQRLIVRCLGEGSWCVVLIWIRSAVGRENQRGMKTEISKWLYQPPVLMNGVKADKARGSFRIF